MSRSVEDAYPARPLSTPQGNKPRSKSAFTKGVTAEVHEEHRISVMAIGAGDEDGDACSESDSVESDDSDIEVMRGIGIGSKGSDAARPSRVTPGITPGKTSRPSTVTFDADNASPLTSPRRPGPRLSQAKGTSTIIRDGNQRISVVVLSCDDDVDSESDDAKSDNDSESMNEDDDVLQGMNMVAPIDGLTAGFIPRSISFNDPESQKETVRLWLEHSVKLPQYIDNFMQNGFESMEFIKN